MLYVNGDDAVETDGDTSKNPNEKTIKPTEAELSLDFFWPKVQEEVKNIQQVDAKNQVLPLARIKKIMKLDEDAKMIAAEAPLLFAKAAEIFIQELTLRAWIHTEENRRRTLQRNDVAKAISKCDQFDFLIDIVPREEVKTTTERKEAEPAKPATTYSQDQVQYYVQLAQQHQQALQNTPGTVNIINTAGTAGNQGGAGGASVIAAPQNILLATGNAGTTATTTGQTTVMNSLQSPHQQIQLLQQVVTPSGDITHVPVTISQNHLNLLRMQMQNNANAQHQQVLIPTMQAQQPSLVQVSAGQQNPGVSNTATGGIFLNTTQATISDDKRTNLVNSFRPNC